MREESGPDRYICFKLSKVMRKIQRYYENTLAPYDITPVQFYVLAALWESDGTKFKDLAESVSMDGSTLTGILDRMERSGYVERRNDPEDRRSLLIFLSPKAKQLGEEMISTAIELDRRIESRFTKKDYCTFLQVLDRLFDTHE
jgi:MarR family transcriptional regulator, organic hydroperoxide resistance regulator